MTKKTACTAQLKLCPFKTSSERVFSQAAKSRRDTSLRQRVQILDERSHCSIQTRHLRVGGIDQVVLIRSMSARSMTKSKMSRREIQRRIREDVPRPRSGRARPQQGILAELFVRRHLRLDQLRVGRGLVRIVASAHVDLDIAEAVLGEVLLEQRQR